MEASRNDEDGYLRGALQRSTSSKVGTHRRLPPRVETAVHVEEARGVVDVPAARVGVDACFRLSLSDAVGFPKRESVYVA